MGWFMSVIVPLFDVYDSSGSSMELELVLVCLTSLSVLSWVFI